LFPLSAFFDSATTPAPTTLKLMRTEQSKIPSPPAHVAHLLPKFAK